MAAERKPFFLFRPRFVLLILYVAAYWVLRNNSIQPGVDREIVIQAISLPSPTGQQVFRMVGPHPDIPHWRQQLWRALFSLPMVVEEEGRKAFEQGRTLYTDAHSSGQRMVSEGQRVVNEGQRLLEDARQFMPAQNPPRQQQPGR